MPDFRHIILPDSGADLLRRELASAFAAVGLRVTRAHPVALQDPLHEHSLARLAEDGPALLFSVNFQGLNPLRQSLETLEAHKGIAAVWCVDNPWSQLAGVRDPRWKTLPFFVTDHSFLPGIKRHGATRALHLPLAASADSFAPQTKRDAAFPPPDDLAPFVFVGRSAFPGKEAFFAGQALPPALLETARALLPEGKRPDLAWWEAALCPEQTDAFFWPGKKARLPALGAEESALSWRALCLTETATAGKQFGAKASAAETPAGTNKTAAGESVGLDIFGDEGWRPLLPQGARLLPPVDYYARLPGIYHKARFNLCLTSLQLPAGLTQRHFDVWTAGGLCLTDNTPGLVLFPEELTRPITFTKPADILSTAEAVEKSPGGRAGLIAAWQGHLQERHTYGHRIRTVLEHVTRREG